MHVDIGLDMLTYLLEVDHPVRFRGSTRNDQKWEHFCLSRKNPLAR